MEFSILYCLIYNFLPISKINGNASSAAFRQFSSKSAIIDLADNSNSYDAMADFNKEKKVMYSCCLHCKKRGTVSHNGHSF